MKNSFHTAARRKRLKQEGLCPSCGKLAPEPARTKCLPCLEYFRAYNKKRQPKIRPVARAYHRRVRSEVIAKYGGTCTCCGETQIEFLVIDHKNNDGNKERRTLYGTNRGSSSSWYSKLKREDVRHDLQVLCNNCNIAKAFYGSCPHSKD